MIVAFNPKHAVLVASMLALAACGGGGGGSGSTGGSSNAAPTADAGADQSIDEQTSVSLNGNGSSDPDGNSLTYSWTQTAGASVTISSGSSAQASFDAPDVGIGSSVSLTFQLRVSDGSANDTDTIVVTVNGVSNSTPIVDAGADLVAGELSTVNLSGSASDTDLGDSLSYTWTQTGGTNVSITDSTSANASFDTPDVGPGGETLTFELAVNDGTTTVTDTIDVDVAEALAVVSVSGQVFYEFVPPLVQGSQCTGLDFASTETRPIRRATVELRDDNTVLDTTVAGDDGSYSFNDIPANTDVRVRVLAELKQSGANAWDVEVRDNVDLSANPAPLASRPLYAVQWAPFNTGSSNVTGADFTATTGYVNGSYRENRSAAPFAILDAMYSAMQLIISVDPAITFPPLDAFWSVNNTRIDSGPYDIDAGEFGVSFYRTDINSLFVLGDSTVDTEEFDDHIINHEWFHYFEDNFSRSDSIGGSHFLGESLDLRLAWGEGFAHALSAISLANPQHCDTGSESGAGSFGFNSESNTSGRRGWFNEMSVMTFVYDLWDTNVDGVDDGSIGFGPIYNTMVGPQRSTDAFTTMFSFAAELRPMLNAADRAFLDAQLNRENVDTPNVTIFGDGQVTTPANALNGGRDLTPVYTEVQTNGGISRVCVNNDYQVEGVPNKVSDWRYLQFTTPSQGSWTVTIQANPLPPVTNDPPPAGRDRSDPDVWLWQGGVILQESRSGIDDLEQFATVDLDPGTYVLELQEFRYIDDGAATDFPSQVCYDVSIAAN